MAIKTQIHSDHKERDITLCLLMYIRIPLIRTFVNACNLYSNVAINEVIKIIKNKLLE